MEPLGEINEATLGSMYTVQGLGSGSGRKGKNLATGTNQAHPASLKTHHPKPETVNLKPSAEVPVTARTLWPPGGGAR